MLKLFIIESIEELRSKVLWPSYKKLYTSALLVFGISLFFVFLIMVIDFFCKSGLAWFYAIF